MKPPVEQRAEPTGWTGPLARPAQRLQPLLKPRRRTASEDTQQLPDTKAAPKTLFRDAAYKRTLGVADMLAAGVTLIVTIALIGDDRLTLTAALIVPLVVLVSKAIGLYDRDEHVLRKTTLDEAPKIFQVATMFALIAWLAGDQLVVGDLGRTQVLGLWGTLFIALMVCRVAARALVHRVTAPERCLVVGDRASAEWLQHKFDAAHSVRGTIIGHVPLRGRSRSTHELPVLGDVEGIGMVLAQHEVDRVVMAPGSTHPDADELLHAIRLVKALGVKVTVLPRFFEVVGSAVEFDDVDGVPLLGIRHHGLTQSSRVLKRSMDIVGSALILMLLAPLFIAIAVAIKLTSPGPVFFRQPRIGCKDQEFQIIKFRTMCQDAEARKDDLRELNEAGGGLFKIADDPRVTRVGKVLRRASLDELPQLFNVLRGDMSLVGPRPLVPDEDARVEGLHRRRLIVKPGMTGLWQIFGSARIPLHEMVKIDYLYGANWSIWLDVKVLLRTVPFMLSRRGI
jgi:exopolysaccharide biosynthesis polyprenyl glycosylphosphotransferase